MTKRKLFFWGIPILMVLIVMFSVFSDSDLLARPNRIAVIKVRGVIEDVQETLKAIKKYRDDKNVKAVIVRIETPGGAIGPSQELYREVKRTVLLKPVVASLGGVAASGGYYIASATRHIVASPGTITGSIGVIVSFPYLKDLFDKIGYTTTVIKSGKFKDTGNPGREMTAEERAFLQKTIDESHRQFVRDVAQGRNLPQDKVLEVADGRIIMGETAHQLGLVDELGNFQDAVNVAALMGKIEGEPELITFEKSKKSILDFILGTEASEKLSGALEGSYCFLRYQLPL